MKITTKYTKIKNGIYYLKMDKKELELMKVCYELFLYQVDFAKLEMTKDVQKVKEALTEINEVLE